MTITYTLILPYVFCLSSLLSCQVNTDDMNSKIEKIYKESKLSGIVTYNVFEKAMTGYYQLSPKKKNIITIIDFSKPSTEERFHVIDIQNKKLLFNCLTSHAQNTGNNYAKNFSNTEGSKKTSIGFFMTAETYSGKHGYSLKLDGLEKGINDNARKRAIVIHAANYVSYEFIKEHGRLGRSWGCPALPDEISKEVIDTIKDGSVLFIFADESDYFSKSKYIKQGE